MKYQLFPRSRGMTVELCDVVKCFEVANVKINSVNNTLGSDDVLKHLTMPLES